MTKQEQFFYDHAGYSIDQGETQEQGKLRTAQEYAAAETWAVQNGYSFDIRPDPDADESFMDDESAEYQATWRGMAWYCVMCDESGNLVQSLSGCYGHANYERVVKAELALKQMEESKVAA